MDLGIVVMGIIILINLIVVGSVMYFGSKHDTHNEIRSPESSRAVQVLHTQFAAAERKSRESKAPTSSPAESAPEAQEEKAEAVESE